MKRRYLFIKYIWVPIFIYNICTWYDAYTNTVLLLHHTLYYMTYVHTINCYLLNSDEDDCTVTILDIHSLLYTSAATNDSHTLLDLSSCTNQNKNQQCLLHTIIQ